MGELGIPILQRFPSGHQFYDSKQLLVFPTRQEISFSDLPEKQNWVSQAARTKWLPTMPCLTAGRLFKWQQKVPLESIRVTVGTSELWGLHCIQLSNTKRPSATASPWGMLPQPAKPFAVMDMCANCFLDFVLPFIQSFFDSTKPPVLCLRYSSDTDKMSRKSKAPILQGLSLLNTLT